ncbi:MAG TPA: endonuclease/exonuclease/phosphatase family protein [Acidimicrobiia bacterium]|nr:endonuclease/exonuclease/phosphatase family protein [Acidimicrobiia bacterium]
MVTFNAHAGVRPRPISVPGTWVRSRKPERGPYDLAGVLAGFDADVVVVQESYRPDDGECAVDVAAAARGMELFEAPFGRAVIRPWPHLIRSGERTIGTKGLAVLTRLPARRLADIPIPRVPADPAQTRCALHLELDVDGEPLELIVAHLTSRLPHGPPIQLARLRRRLPPRDRRAVVTGDLNFWGPPSAALLPGWRRAVRGRTWPAHRPHSQIDHVLVRDDVEVVEGEVLSDVGSDHRPVRVRLRL